MNSLAKPRPFDTAKVLQLIGAASLRDQLLRDKARAMIVDSAKRI